MTDDDDRDPPEPEDRRDEALTPEQRRNKALAWVRKIKAENDMTSKPNIRSGRD